MRTKYGLIAKVRWLAKGNPETMPHLSDLNYHQHMTLWVRPCVSIHKYSFFSLLINTLFYYFPSLCGNSFLQSCWARGLSLATVPGALVVRIYRSHCCSLTSISGWETEILFQAAAGWGHSRSGWEIETRSRSWWQCLNPGYRWSWSQIQPRSSHSDKSTLLNNSKLNNCQRIDLQNI